MCLQMLFSPSLRVDVKFEDLPTSIIDELWKTKLELFPKETPKDPMVTLGLPFCKPTLRHFSRWVVLVTLFGLQHVVCNDDILWLCCCGNLWFAMDISILSFIRCEEQRQMAWTVITS